MSKRTWNPSLPLKITLGICIVGLGAAVSAYQYFSRDLPSTARLEMIEPTLKTQVFADDGTLIGEYFVEDREIVPLEQIPAHLVDAIVAIEDRKFYAHWGVDIYAVARAALTNLSSNRERPHGASTITQQLARNLFAMYDVTITRKVKEALLALRIERAYSKDEILEMYLNQIYFGSGAYGVQAAAKTFFDKDVSELSPGESALLAGLPKNPRDYSPVHHLDRGLQRRRMVLTAMVDYGALDASEIARIEADSLVVSNGRREKTNFAAYYLENVRRYLERKYGAERLYHDGLRVYTGLDMHLQSVAEDSLESQMQRMEKMRNYEFTLAEYDSLLVREDDPGPPESLQSSVVVIDVETGLVRALVGGRSFKHSKFNRATQARRQPGSAFKPFIFLAAIENGYTPADIILDAPIVLDLPNGDVWKPRNFTEKFAGEVSLRYALNFSINIAAIRLLMALGPISAINYAHRLGIQSNLANVYSLALGVSEVTLLELTNAYATIAAGGMRGDPVFIKKVLDREGRVLEENEVFREEVLDPQSNYMITSLLESVMNEGYGRNSRLFGFKEPAAGKTGTTDECTDAWFVGFTSEIAVGVWSGFDRKQTMGRRMTGARVSLPIWTEVMKAQYRDHKGQSFYVPEGIVHRVICEETGLISTRYCTNVRREVFIEATEPRRACDRHTLPTLSDKKAPGYQDLDRRIMGDH